MSDNLDALGYHGPKAMPWSQPADASTKPDAKEIHERYDNATPSAVQANGFHRPPAESKQEVPIEEPATPEADEALKRELEDRKLPPLVHGRTEEAKRFDLLKRVKTALKNKRFGGDLAHLVPKGATGEQAMAALHKLAEKLTKDHPDPEVQQNLPKPTVDSDNAAFDDDASKVPTRGEGPQKSFARSSASMLSPAMSKYDAGRLARQCNNGGNLNIKKGGK